MARLTEKERSNIVRAGQLDPIWFVREVLGDEPTAYQRDWLMAAREEPLVSIATCHGVGKSRFVGGQLAPWFLCCFPYSEIVTTAPTLRQVSSILWKEIRASLSRARVPLGGKLMRTGWYLDDGWFALGYTAGDDEPNKFQGMHAASGRNLVLVDEAAGISEAIYQEGIASIASAEGSVIVLTGNPTSAYGEFRESHKENSDYRQFKLDAFSTPNFKAFGITLDDMVSGEWVAKVDGQPMPYPHLVTPKWVASRLKRWGVEHPSFQSRVMANFPASGTDALIPADRIEAAKARSLSKEGWLQWGVDVGGRGPDPSIIGAAYESGFYRRIHQEDKSNVVKLASRIATQARVATTAPRSINIDEIGVGQGTFDALSEDVLWNVPNDVQIVVNGIGFAQAPTDKVAYKNRRAEYYWALRDRFLEGTIDIDPQDRRLIEELQHLQYKVAGNGQITIEDKDTFRTRKDGIRRSCDALDAMCYAFAEPDPGVNLVYMSADMSRAH